jgi:hypothetical protein
MAGPGAQLHQMQHGLGQQRVHRIDLVPPRALDLFDHVVPIEVVHPFAGAQATQPLGLLQRPGVGVRPPEIVGHRRLPGHKVGGV